MSRGSLPLISGRVLGQGGSPIEFVNVAVIPGAGGTIYSDDTDDQGNFSISFVPFGTWVMQLTPPSALYQPQARDMSVAPAMSNLVFHLPPAEGSASLSGTVRLSGSDAGLGGVRVDFLGTSVFTTSDAEGGFSFSGLSAGSHTISFTKNGFNPVRLPAVVLRAGANRQDLAMTFADSGPMVFGTVVDARTGEPVRRATVGPLTHQGRFLRSDVTDRCGYFRLIGVPPELGQQFVAFAPGYRSASLSVDVPRTTPVHIALERASNWRAPEREFESDIVARLSQSAVFLNSMGSQALLNAGTSTGANLVYLWRESSENPVTGLIPDGSESLSAFSISGFARPGTYIFELRVKSGNRVSLNTATVSVFMPGFAGNTHASPSDGVVSLPLVEVRAYGDYASAAAWAFPPVDAKTSDSSGDFLFDNLSTGVYWMVARETSATRAATLPWRQMLRAGRQRCGQRLFPLSGSGTACFACGSDHWIGLLPNLYRCAGIFPNFRYGPLRVLRHDSQAGIQVASVVRFRNTPGDGGCHCTGESYLGICRGVFTDNPRCRAR